jgi:N-acetyl-anhydromuramoyl-L-alanine amidase
MEVHKHLLSCARQLSSPNCSARPEGEEISLLVIHNISLPPGNYGGPYIDHLFCNQLDCTVHAFFEEIKDLRVSSHLLIQRDGEVTQYVPFDRKAWHAGKSSFQGREECNDFSIGIELEGCDDEAFTTEQYEKLAKISHELMLRYPSIKSDNIVGHSDIAPGRKTDPGTMLDWHRYRQALFES